MRRSAYLSRTSAASSNSQIFISRQPSYYTAPGKPAVSISRVIRLSETPFVLSLPGQVVTVRA